MKIFGKNILSMTNRVYHLTILHKEYSVEIKIISGYKIITHIKSNYRIHNILKS